MNTVISKDGTSIAYDRSGSGPTVILVTGALGVRSFESSRQLASLLSSDFTVLNYDRRGRGNSGDTLPYSVQREIEDIEALIDSEGDSAYVYGISSGAALALEAASALPTKITKLALYEPPFIVDSTRKPLPSDYVQHLNDLVAANRRGDAVEYFLTDAVEVPVEYIAPMKSGPGWESMESIAHTIAYDGTIMGTSMSGNPLPAQKGSVVTMPTLVISGGASPEWMQNGTQAIADLIPNAQRLVLEGQNHGVESEVLAPVLIKFFKA